MILNVEDIQVLNTQRVLKNPSVSAFFYFNAGYGWIPMTLARVMPMPTVCESDKSTYALLYFNSVYNLPSELSDQVIFSSPLGLASETLYNNLQHPIVNCYQIDNFYKLVKYSCFLGSEGSYCGGDVLIPSKFKGYSLAFMLPKL